MWGAVIGDIVGSVYEFSPIKAKAFGPLFSPLSTFTDDTVCTVALADCLLNSGKPEEYLRRWCRKYPDKGYGFAFRKWVEDSSIGPYDSYGNGAAMRVSPAAAFANSWEEASRLANHITSPTHNHPEGLKGAQATTEAIWMALQGEKAPEIRRQIKNKYEYNLEQTVDQLRPDFIFDETCQETVPAAIICALESTSLEDAIRNAVSLGGDADTLACIAGSIAEALHGCPEELITVAKDKLPADMKTVMDAIYKRRSRQ